MEVCTYNNEMPSAKLFDLIKRLMRIKMHLLSWE